MNEKYNYKNLKSKLAQIIKIASNWYKNLPIWLQLYIGIYIRNWLLGEWLKVFIIDNKL
jgi:hypothetical protein